MKRMIDDLKEKIIEKNNEIKVKDEELQLAESKIKVKVQELENEIFEKETQLKVKYEELESLKTMVHTETVKLQNNFSISPHADKLVFYMQRWTNKDKVGHHKCCNLLHINRTFIESLSVQGIGPCLLCALPLAL
jgi:hypothetical protein